MNEAYDWYRRNYPNCPEFEPRLFEVLRRLAHNGQIYNVYRTGTDRVDGGFREQGRGVLVRMSQPLATFDSGELTRIVIEAHRQCCRVELSARGNYLQVFVTPRDTEGTHLFERHPSLADLAARCAPAEVPV